MTALAVLELTTAGASVTPMRLAEAADAEVETLIGYFSDARDQRVKRTRLIREQTARLAAADQEIP